jgi:hypothetical protein
MSRPERANRQRSFSRKFQCQAVPRQNAENRYDEARWSAAGKRPSQQSFADEVVDEIREVQKINSNSRIHK